MVDSFRSQWFITFKPTPHLDKKHTVFGNMVGGDEVLDALEKLQVKPGTERPAKLVRITEIVMFVPLPYTLLRPMGLMSGFFYPAIKIRSRSTRGGKRNAAREKLKRRKKQRSASRLQRKRQMT